MSKAPRESLQRKSAARMAAVQALYSYGISDKKPKSEKLVEQLIEQWGESAGIDEEWPADIKPEQSMLRDVTSGALEHLADIDSKLESIIKDNWKSERMDPVMLAIFRCATYELTYKTERKVPVIVDEYVTIASGYFEGNELGFVHSGLQQLVAIARPNA